MSSSYAFNLSFFIIISQLMKKSDEEGVGLIIESYFRISERQLREQQQKLIKISQIYAKQGWQRRFINQMYEIFKKILKRDTFPTLCRRLLRIWDELIENQVKKNTSTGYRTALSEIIVESYTFIFPLIIDYRFHDLILDFKIYRMLWAKYISDDSFHQLRTQIGKMYRNFDLNKGFTPENVEKIRKRFIKKGATEEDIHKYMGITQLERRIEPSPSAQRRQIRESSQEEESDGRKRIKSEVASQPQHYARQNYDGYNPEQYMYQNPNNPYPQQPQYQMPQGGSYPGRPNLPPQPNLPPSFPPTNKNLYPTYSRPYGNNFNPPLPPPISNQGPHYQMPLGVSSTPPAFYPEQKNAQFGSGYQEYNPNYPPTYPPQGGYGPQTATYPSNTPQTGSYLPSQPPNYPNYPPNPSNQRPPPPPKMPQSDFPTNPRDLKRQSPEFTPKMSRSPLQPQQQYYPQIFDSASTAKTDFRPTSPEIPLPERPDRNKHKMLLANLRKGLSECKECGVHFLSRENLEEHKRQHFQEAQRRFQAKQAELMGNPLGIQKQRAKAKENFDNLCTMNQWISAGTSGQGEAAYQVSIKRLPPIDRTAPVFYCYFCNEDLEVNWCAQLQQWTLNNGVKVHEADRGLCVAHFDCYECFRSEDASFHTTAQPAR